MSKDICILCLKEGLAKTEFSNLSLHLKTKHSMSMEEYEEEIKNLTDDSPEIPDTDPMFEEDSSDVVTQKQQIERIFEYKSPILPSDTVQSVLDKYGMEISELNDIISRYKKGSAINVIQALKQQTDSGNLKANELKDKERVEVHDIHTANSLTEHHGFVCEIVHKKTGTTPKTWVLVKKN